MHFKQKYNPLLAEINYASSHHLIQCVMAWIDVIVFSVKRCATTTQINGIIELNRRHPLENEYEPRGWTAESCNLTRGTSIVHSQEITKHLKSCAIQLKQYRWCSGSMSCPNIISKICTHESKNTCRNDHASPNRVLWLKIIIRSLEGDLEITSALTVHMIRRQYSLQHSYHRVRDNVWSVAQ